jgi:glycosyltransferase involved in cell wall biosynthesis
MLKISVAIATYCGAQYLREQLDSIARQTLLPFELVITDDGSTDATAQIVDEFAQTAPFPVRFFQNEVRLGYADNFLRAASLCQGDLIAFCDQDDFWRESKLSVSSSHFSDPGILLVIHSGNTLVNGQESGELYPLFTQTGTLAHGASDPFANHPGFAMTIRREVLSVAEYQGRPGVLYGHDHWVWLLAACAGDIFTIAESLSWYRQHNTNVYGAPQKKTFLDKIGVGREIPGYLEVADAELACSEMLTKSLDQCPVQWKQKILESVRSLQLRSRLHRLRAGIYAGEQTILGKVGIITRIFLLGGYLPDKSRTRMGPRAAIKDIILGVCGIGRSSR